MYGLARTEPSHAKSPGQQPSPRRAFVDRKSEIDAILTRLATLSAEHFDRAPDDITWADVGTLGSYLEGLRRASK